jgi:hypothetical protein
MGLTFRSLSITMRSNLHHHFGGELHYPPRSCLRFDQHDPKAVRRALQHDRHLARQQIDITPPQARKLTTSHARVQRKEP